MMSRRCVRPSSFASASAFCTYSEVSSACVRPLISMLIGVRGNARMTSLSVGTRKSAALVAPRRLALAGRDAAQL